MSSSEPELDNKSFPARCLKLDTKDSVIFVSSRYETDSIENMKQVLFDIHDKVHGNFRKNDPMHR